MAYDKLEIARELDETAQGLAYHGNALRVAKDMPGLDAEDRSLLDRYATGLNAGMDHLRLQDLAIKIRAATPQFERVRLRRDTHFADGRLKAQAGAIGSVVGRDQGCLTIHFDDTEHFVELDGSGLRIAHNVPPLAVETITSRCAERGGCFGGDCCLA